MDRIECPRCHCENDAPDPEASADDVVEMECRVCHVQLILEKCVYWEVSEQ